jgi:hypothetical protein
MNDTLYHRNVERLHPGGLHPNPHLPRPGLRFRYVDQPEHLWTTRLEDQAPSRLRSDLSERDDAVEAVARHHGFGTAEALRRTFHRIVGIAPSDCRERFRMPDA